MKLQTLPQRLAKRHLEIALSTSNFDLVNLRRHVAFFPDCRLAYNRIKKNANTRISAFLSDLLYRRTYANSRSLKSGLMRATELGWFDVWRLRDYYSIVFVRDPYGRVLSAFLDKLASGNKNNLPEYGQCPGFGDNSAAGFLTFLRYLEAGGLHDDMHWWPQSELLYQPAADFSFIGRLENTVADMRRVLDAIGQDPERATALERPHALEANRGRSVTGASSRLDAYYTDEGRAIVRRLYEADFETFGYAA